MYIHNARINGFRCKVSYVCMLRIQNCEVISVVNNNSISFENGVYPNILTLFKIIFMNEVE